MPITNGQESVCGLVLDGHFGWHNHVRMLEVANDFGWEIDDELRAIMERYDAGAVLEDELGNWPEIIADAMTEAETWLNDHTAVECAVCGYNAGTAGLFLGHATIHAHTVVEQRYIWHWHDGEFFLSPICDPDNREDCTDDTCAHWD